MKLPARGVAWLLPFLLTACFHKTHSSHLQPYLPPPSTAPKPETTAVELPPSAATIPSRPLANDADSQPQGHKPPVRHRRWANKTTQQAANTAPPEPSSVPPAEPAEVSAIGQLSSGDPANSDLRRQTLDSIAATERGLNGINRALSDQERKTTAQIREFLKQAREALATGDVDGAHTLAAKAKVLLSELAGT